MFKIIDGQRTDFSKETEALLEYTPLPKDIIEHLIKPQFKVSHPAPSQITLTLDQFIKQVNNDTSELYSELARCKNIDVFENDNHKKLSKRVFKKVIQHYLDKENKVLILQYGETDQNARTEYFGRKLRDTKFDILIDETSGYCAIYVDDNTSVEGIFDGFIEARLRIDELIEESENELYNSIQTLYV